MIDQRLAVYGSLAPGRANYHQLAGLVGTWRPGRVVGRLVAQGWGVHLGFPALVIDATGSSIDVQLFESVDLPAHWPRLDAFEGDGYRRSAVDVLTSDGVVPAWIYAAADAGTAPPG